MTLYVKVSGSWRTVSSQWTKVSGTWRSVPNVYAKVNGTWMTADVPKLPTPTMSTTLDPTFGAAVMYVTNAAGRTINWQIYAPVTSNYWFQTSSALSSSGSGSTTMSSGWKSFTNTQTHWIVGKSDVCSGTLDYTFSAKTQFPAAGGLLASDWSGQVNRTSAMNSSATSGCCSSCSCC